MTPVFNDSRLLVIRDKVERGQRLNFDDGVTLAFRSPDLLGVGWMANPRARTSAWRQNVLRP